MSFQSPSWAVAGPSAPGRPRRRVVGVALTVAACLVVISTWSPQPAWTAPGPVIVGPLRSDSAWIRFQGWGTAGYRLAWREGTRHETNTIGDPVEICRLNADGIVEDCTHISENLNVALSSRGIIRHEPLEAQQVAAGDVLVATATGVVYAVVTRANPLAVGVLRRDGKGHYRLVRRHPLPAPLTHLKVEAYASRDRRFIAFVVHLGSGQARTPLLMVVPTGELGDEGSENDATSEGGVAADGSSTAGDAGRAKAAGAADVAATAHVPLARPLSPARWLQLETDSRGVVRLRSGRHHALATAPRN